MNRFQCRKFIKDHFNSQGYKVLQSRTEADIEYERVYLLVGRAYILRSDLEVIKKKTGMHMNNINNYNMTGVFEMLFVRRGRHNKALYR